jgi:hypothetical protein
MYLNTIAEYTLQQHKENMNTSAQLLVKAMECASMLGYTGPVHCVMAIARIYVNTLKGRGLEHVKNWRTTWY